MKILNPFKIIDWEIHDILSVVLAIQLSILGLIAFDSINLEIPILRQLIGILYLTFIPGLLLLRILKVQNLGSIETLLYSVGLSLSTLMSTGFLMNIFYPLFGIYNPISTKYLVATISLIVLIFCVVAYTVNSNFSNPNFITSYEILNPKLLFLCIIPFFTIFGVYFRNIYNTNIVLLLLLFIIAVIEICVFSNFFSQHLYPIIIFVSSFFLLFSNSLISNYISGWDIHVEYYLSQLVISNSLWNYSNSLSNVNAMLSIVMLAPIYSSISDLSLVWVFKIVYPFIYCFLPLGLYNIYKKQIGVHKIAFMSVLFFISFFVFYTEMLQLARQQIAEFYLVLNLLVIFDENLHKIKKAVLLIIFIFSLSVSHYGVSYIFIGLIIFTVIFLYLGSIVKVSSAVGDWRFSKNYVLLYVTFTLLWYIYISSSSTFDTIIGIGEHIYGNMFNNFLNPEFSQGLSLIQMKPTSFLQSLSKYIHFIAQFFIFLGILNLFIRSIPLKLDKEYIGFSLSSFILLVAAIIVPFLSNSFNTSRLYHLCLIFLSPLSIIGGLFFIKTISSLFNMNPDHPFNNRSLQILSIFFVFFMLFNTGFISNVLNQNFQYKISKDNDSPLFNDKEVFCAKWILNVKNSSLIYGDNYRFLLLKGMDWNNVSSLSSYTINLNKKFYLFLGTVNILDKQVLIRDASSSSLIVHYVGMDQYCNNKNEIYSNGGAEIFY